jgi:DNA-binding MarR family transcriptional regulator
VTERPKKYLAAIPARAFLDRRLDGGRFQVLAALALHDRMGCGQGCWASSETLVGRTALAAGTVKNFIVDLVKWGYVERVPRPGTKTHRTLFVLYDAEADRAAFNGQSVISRNDGCVGDDQPVISGGHRPKRRRLSHLLGWEQGLDVALRVAVAVTRLRGIAIT